MPDWNTGWTPPGTPADPTPHQDSTGFDWSWWNDFWRADPNARPARNPRAGPPPKPGAPDPFGDWLKQQFTQSPEDQLQQMIQDKMGLGAASDRATHARIVMIAKQAAHHAMTDPAYREQLAMSMGWNLQNPHVAYWLMHGGGIPDNPTAGGPTTSAAGGTKAAAPTAPSSTIGAPFDASKWGGRASDPGYTYGQTLDPQFAAAAGVSQQWGVDYALPEGTPQNSPFAGTVIEAGYNGPYGNTVVVKMANGYTYRVAHLESINVAKGATVAVGTELGPTGTTGNSDGPHVLIEMRDASGNPIDPTPIVDSLLKGDSTGAQKFMNDYVSAEAAVGGPFKTSDGHLIYPGSNDYNVFFAAQQLWRKRYGGDPPWSFVSSLIAAGSTTTEQITNVMDQMSSDIPNMNWGQRDALTNDANTAATKAWDRPIPDATVKQLAALGITTPSQIQGWISSHPANALDSKTYSTYFDATNPQTQQLWQQPPSPDMIAHIHDVMNKGPQ